MEILDPVGRSASPAGALAPRPAALEGLVVGLLDNSKPNAGTLLAAVASALAERVGARGVRVWRKPGSSVAAAPAVLEEIQAGCGVVLTASAD